MALFSAKNHLFFRCIQSRFLFSLPNYSLKVHERRRLKSSNPNEKACIYKREEMFSNRRSPSHHDYPESDYDAEDDYYDDEERELWLATKRRLAVAHLLSALTSLEMENRLIGGKQRGSIKKIAVVGVGWMGSGISACFLSVGVKVLIKDANQVVLNEAFKSIERNLKFLKSMRSFDIDIAMSNLRSVVDYNDFGDLDMAIEAVSENLQLKKTVFAELDKCCPSQCLLATTTSSIDLQLMGLDRIVGFRFFSPAHAIRLVEIVHTEKTMAKMISELVSAATLIGNRCILVKSCSGFATTRIFSPYVQGAHMLVHLGIDIFRVERLFLSFGMRWGPFEFQDLTGLGVTLNICEEIARVFPDRAFVSPLPQLLIDNGRKGYFLYGLGMEPKRDISVQRLINESIEMLDGKHITDEEIKSMILFCMVNVACEVMSEGIVLRASYIDIASVHAMGFPSEQGGLMYWADSIGPKHIHESLESWAIEYGSFFTPCNFLKERASKGIPLSAQL